VATELGQHTVTQRQLVESEHKIKAGVAALQAERDQLRRNCEALDAKTHELSEWLARNERPESERDIDAETEPADPLERQCVARVCGPGRRLTDWLMCVQVAACDRQRPRSQRRPAHVGPRRAARRCRSAAVPASA
jgi:hypothetical protein